MKKQLIALTLSFFLVGCMNQNKQKEVSYQDFVYETVPFISIKRPKSAVASRKVTIKTNNLAALGMVDVNETNEDQFTAIFNEDATSYNIEPAGTTFSYIIHAMSTKAACDDFAPNASFETKYYLNPMKVAVTGVEYHSSSPITINSNSWSFTYGKDYWVKTIEWDLKTKYVSDDGQTFGEYRETGSVKLVYVY